MGVLGELAGPLATQYQAQSTWVQIIVGFTAFFFAAIVLNILKQLLLKDPKQPPVVFHYVPFVGSTVTYGMAPFDFFNTNRKKVCFCTPIDARGLG